MSTLTIRSKTEDDDPWLVDTRNRVNDHLPGTSVEHIRHWERVDRVVSEAYVERYVIERGGNRVGSMVLEKMWWTEKPGGYWTTIVVLPDLWNEGIGSWAYDRLLERLEAVGAERVYAMVRNDRANAQRFAQQRGFEKTGHADRWSRLQVKAANLDGYIGAESKLAGEGIVIKTLAEVGQSEEFLRKLHAAQDEAVADIPMSEQFKGSPFEQFLEELKDPDLSPDRIWVAMDGDDPVGLAMLPLEATGEAFNGFTGTRRAYRGKGVARALKFKTLEWAAANNVGYIYTANDITNERMLAINNSLGYRELPISEEVTKILVEATGGA